MSVRSDLVRRAKALGVDLSTLLDGALEQAIRDAERQWLRDNKEAIDYANKWIAKHGSFADEWRKF